MTLLLAYCLLAIGQAAIGVNVVAGKFLIDGGVPIHVYLCGRFMASTVLMTILMCLLKETLIIKDNGISRLSKKDWFFLSMQALTGGFLFNVLFYWGIQYTTAISAGIISSALPAIIAICAFLFLGEKLNKWKYLGIMLAMVGILIINLDNTKASAHISGSFLGDFVILLSMVPEALYSIFNKFTNQKVTPLGGATVVNFMIFLMLLPLGAYEFLSRDLSGIVFSSWVLLLLTGFASMFFFWFWSRGLLHVSASSAAIFTSVLPVSTTLMAWAFLHEQFGIYDGMGMCLVLLSIAIGTGWLPGLLKKKNNQVIT